MEDFNFVQSGSYPIKGQAQLQMSLDGTSLEPKGEIKLLNVNYNEIPLNDGHVRFSTELNGGLVFNGLLPSSGISLFGRTDSLAITERYQVSIEFKKSPLHFLYPKTPTGESLTMVGSGMLRLGSEQNTVSVDTLLETLEIRIRDGLIRLFKPSSIRYRDGTLSINSLEFEDGESTRVQINGEKNAYGKLDYQLLGQIDLRYLPSFVKLVERSSGTAIVKGSM